MDFLKKLGPLKFALAAFGLLTAIILVIFLSFKLTTPPLSLLYTNLSTEDSMLIESRLDAMGELYQSSNNGKDISVPISRVLGLRMNFAQEGIPHSGSIVGYEIFDRNEGLGTSQFVYNVNLVRALEGEIARTIGSLTPIESARVHLVMPKKELFSKVGTEPSASVVVKMKGSQTLNKQEVAAISHIVSTAVSGLKLDNITIVDNHGKALKLAASEDNAMSITDNVSDFQKTVEEKYRFMLEELVEKFVGIGKVKANVAAEINFDREIINSEVFDPDGQVIRSRKVSEENEKDQDRSSDLSVATNIPNAQGSGAGGGANHNKNRTDEITNYEISKTITNKITESGRIKKLSIAILIDGTYVSKLAADGKTLDYTYTPRSDAELEKIKLLATSAVGLDSKRGDKIEVINMQFSEEFAAVPQQEKPFAWLRNELDNIIQTIMVGIVIILVMLLIIRPVLIKAMENRKASLEDQALSDAILNPSSTQTPSAQANTTVAIGLGIEPNKNDSSENISANTDSANIERKKGDLIKYINETIEKHPEEAVAVIRSWMYAGK